MNYQINITINTMKKTILTLISSFTLLVVFVTPVLAQTATPASLRSAANLQARIQKLITRGDADISQRLTAINAAITKIQGLQKLSDVQKTTITGNLQNSITNLNTLKSKIDADTDITALSSDVTSIMIHNRIYMLIIPQTAIVTAVDRIQVVTVSMQALVTKLQTRLTQDQTAGKNVTALQTSLTDMQAKITDAQNQSQAADNLISPLAPDGGNATIITSNNQALQAARSDIKTGNSDLKTAYTDAKSIVTGLKALK
jgi:hypothetical protein